MSTRIPKKAQELLQQGCRQCGGKYMLIRNLAKGRWEPSWWEVRCESCGSRYRDGRMPKQVPDVHLLLLAMYEKYVKTHEGAHSKCLECDVRDSIEWAKKFHKLIWRRGAWRAGR